MENDSPFTQPSNGPAIFAALRDVLAELYAEESPARVVVADAGLDAKQIAFSSRAQTNWHNILAAAIHQARLDPLLKLALADYGTNPALLAAYDQYRRWIDQGGDLEVPDPLPVDAGVAIARDVNVSQGDFVGRDKHVAGDEIGGNKVEGDQIDARSSQGFLSRPTAPVTQHFGTAIHLGPLKISKPITGILFTSLVAVVLLIGTIAIYTRGTFHAITAPTPTPTPTIPEATPTRTPLPTATPLAFTTQAVSETLIVIATFHGQAAVADEPHVQIRRAISAAASHNEQQLRVEVEPTVLDADQRVEAEALGKRYNASMVIWGEATRVGIVVNFLNLKEPNSDASFSTITETERTELVNPSAYARFITQELPQTMNFFALFAVGQSYYLKTQFSLAIKWIEAAIALAPPDAKLQGLAEAHYQLGWLYIISKPQKSDQAIANLGKAIHFNLDYKDAYVLRGIIYGTQGKLEEAIADYDKVILLDPNNAIHYRERGSLFHAQGKLEEAIADYSRAIQLDPDNAVGYSRRGNVYKHQNQLDKAIADYDRAIQLDSNLASTYSNRGFAYLLQSKLKEAIVDFDRASQLIPNNAVDYVGRGIAYLYLDKPNEALIDFRRYLELQPDGENRVQVEEWIAEAEAALAKQR